MSVRLGIAGEAWCFHARAIASVVNGEQVVGEERRGIFEQVSALRDLVEISSVWDPVRGDAEKLARHFGIPHIASSGEELAKSVDGVLVLGDKDMQFQRHAWPFLDHRIPCYVDKPLSPSLKEAHSLIDRAQETGTPFFSASPTRFAPQLQAFGRDLATEIGSPISMTLLGPGELFFYGVHLVDILVSLLGPDVAEVHNIGRTDEELIKVTYRTGVVACIQVLSGINSRFHVLAAGTEGWQHLYIDNYRDYFANLVRSVYGMVQTGKAPIQLHEVLRVIEVLTAAKASRIQGRPVALDEPLADMASSPIE